MLSHGAECNIGIFCRVSHIFNLFQERLGELNNSKIWKTKIFANIALGNVRLSTLSLNACWNQELSYLLTNLMLTSYIQIDVKTARTNLNWLYFQTFDSFLFPYFNQIYLFRSFVLYLMIFGNQFIFERFIPNFRLSLKSRTY